MKELLIKTKARIVKFVNRVVTRDVSPEEKIKEKQKADYDYLTSQGVDTELGYVTLFGLPIIRKEPGSIIRMGKNVVLTSNSEVNLAGINHPVIIATYSKDSVVILEDNVGISGASINCVTKCVLKNGVMIGANVNIWDTDFHPVEVALRKKQLSIQDAQTAPIVIEKNVWIGANSTILKGVTIGENTVVGAMSLVNKSLPSNSICAGNPAKRIKSI